MGEKALTVLQKTLTAFTKQNWFLAYQNFDLPYPLGVLQIINEEPAGRESKRYANGKEIVDRLFELDFQMSFITTRSRSNPEESRFLARRVLGNIAAGWPGTYFQNLWWASREAEGVKASILSIGGISNEVESDAGDQLWTAMSDGRMNAVYTYSEADVPCVEEEGSLPDVNLDFKDTEKSPDRQIIWGRR